MKKSNFALLAPILIAFACATPPREASLDMINIDNYDSLDSYVRKPFAVKTVTLDSLIPEVAFDTTDSTTYYVLENYYPDSVYTVADLQMIDSTCAVIIYPTDEQLATLRLLTSEHFMQIADAYSYYQGRAIEMLDSIDIGTVSAQKRFIGFKSSDRKLKPWELDVRKEGAPAWNLIFFKTDKQPEIISITELSKTRIMEYFDKDVE
jgi:hypothetical protein